MSDKIIDGLNLGKILEDEAFHYKNKSLWAKDNALIDKLTHSLSPFIEDYSSSLRPLFLYELKSVEILNLFNFVLVRDGALGLIDFFLRNPYPNEVKCKLLIHSELCVFVPNSWGDNIVFYDLSSQRGDISSFNQFSSKREILFVAYINNFNIDIEKVKRLTKEFRAQDYEKAYCLLTYVPSFNEGAILEQKSTYFDVAHTLTLEFKEKLEFINWKEAFSLEAPNLDFLDLKVGPVFYSDSYVDHFFMSAGARNLLYKKLSKGSAQTFVEQSHYHGFSFYSAQEIFSYSAIKEKRKEVLNELKDLHELGFLQTDQNFLVNNDDVNKVELTNTSTKSFVFECFKNKLRK